MANWKKYSSCGSFTSSIRLGELLNHLHKTLSYVLIITIRRAKKKKQHQNMEINTETFFYTQHSVFEASMKPHTNTRHLI